MAAAVQKNVIRGPKLEVVRTHANGLGSLEAYLLVSDIVRAFSDRTVSKDRKPENPGLRAAFDAVIRQTPGLVLASNKRMSKALVETDEWQSIKPAFSCWTGTMTAYAEPDTPFIRSRMFSRDDNALVYEPRTDERWIFLLSGVDAKYLETPNVILVAEHPFYSLEVYHLGRGYRDITVNPHVVDGLCGFPTRPGCYAGDLEHDIPIGEQIDENDPRARHLGRENAGRVVLLPAGTTASHGSST